MVMKSAEGGRRCDAAHLLDGAMDRSVLVERPMRRTTPNPWLVRLGTAYVELFRNVPLLVQMFLWYFVLPELLPDSGWAASRRLVLHGRGRARLLYLGARRQAGARRKIFRRSVLQTQPPSRALVSPDDLEHIGGGRLLLSQSR